MAMYRAKKQGLKSWHIFDLSDDYLEDLESEYQLISELKHALREDQFILNFQPIASLKRQTISHYEVLLRFTDSQGAPVSPAIFIPIVEKVGLIHEIDMWVFESAVQKIDKGFIPETVKLAINISAPSLQDSNLANKIHHIIMKYKVKPEQIIIELTETAYIDNLNQVATNLGLLRNQGFAIALDDFGVGFSSFSYLKQLPLSYVKLDGSYIQNLLNNEENQAFIQSVVIMSRAF